MKHMIEKRAEIARQILADFSDAPPIRMPIVSFNDDDVYVYESAAKRLVRRIGCKEQSAADAICLGSLRVRQGEAWAFGMSAKRLGLWEAA